MDNPNADKVAVVTEVRSRLDAAEAVVVTEYRGLDVAALAELRRSLRDAGGTYKIYKNTLLRIAAREQGLELDDLLTGPTAVAFVEGDVAGVAKALRDYARGNPALVLKGGLLGEVRIGAEQISALAELPSREQMLSEIAGLFAAPMQQFASLLDAVPRTFAYGLQALIDKGGAASGSTTDAPAAESAETDPTPAAKSAEIDTQSAEADEKES